MVRYGFRRREPGVVSLPDEAIFPEFVRGSLRVTSSWDRWGGYELESKNEATDQFLKQFYEKHGW